MMRSEEISCISWHPIQLPACSLAVGLALRWAFSIPSQRFATWIHHSSQLWRRPQQQHAGYARAMRPQMDRVDKTLVAMQELNSVEAIKTAVQCGLGAAFVSACAIQKELDLGLVARVDIAGVRLARGVLLVSNPHRAQPHPTFQVRPAPPDHPAFQPLESLKVTRPTQARSHPSHTATVMAFQVSQGSICPSSSRWVSWHRISCFAHFHCQLRTCFQGIIDQWPHPSEMLAFVDTLRPCRTYGRMSLKHDGTGAITSMLD